MYMWVEFRCLQSPVLHSLNNILWTGLKYLEKKSPADLFCFSDNSNLLET